MIRLYTSFYPESDPARREELLECLRRNLECSVIDSVCLLLERMDEPPVYDEKLQCRKIAQRPTYRDFFQWCNQNVQTNDDISIVANSDIYFAGGLTGLTCMMKSHQCAALARWNVRPHGEAELFDRNDSQDSWIFRGSIRSFACDYHIGIPRCDNRILYELEQAGYDVINPAFSIRSYHLHRGERGEYVQEQLRESVDPPYAYIWPHNLYSWPATMLHNLRHPSDHVRWQIDWRWIASTLPVRAVRKLLPLFGKRP
jgi:hypothetical protein